MKTIKIFDKEREDGLEEKVLASNSLAYLSQLIVKDEPFNVSEYVKSVAENKNQFDLYYLESVLVSTGWNKNDDVFLADSTWSARNTPEDKQFNFMHDEDQIIGHITGSYVVDKNGNKIEDTQETPPEEFDIITRAVLYNSWTKEDNVERMKKLIAEIEEGKWFVSMECLFAGFDYALSGKDGATKIVAREEETSFLTKHLRAYGGTGEYEEYKVGRALRKISFSGKGLVSKPANPRSLILKKSAVAEEKHEGEQEMPTNEDFASKISELEAKLKASTDLNKDLQAKLDSVNTEKVKAFELKIDEYESIEKDLNDKIKANQERISELETQLSESTEQLQAAMKQMEEMKKKEKMQKRMASLLEEGFEKDEAEELLSIDSLTDEVFETVVAAMKKKMAKYQMKKKEEMMKEEKDMAELSQAFDKLESKDTELNVKVEEVKPDIQNAVASFVEAFRINKGKK